MAACSLSTGVDGFFVLDTIRYFSDYLLVSCGNCILSFNTQFAFPVLANPLSV